MENAPDIDAHEGAGEARMADQAAASPLSPGLSTYSRARFLAAVKGLIPVSEYVEEVAAHVERQLPGQRESATTSH